MYICKSREHNLLFTQDKEVILFHSTDELVYNGAPAKFQKQVKSKLEKQGVQLVLGEKHFQ